MEIEFNRPKLGQTAHDIPQGLIKATSELDVLS